MNANEEAKRLADQHKREEEEIRKLSDANNPFKTFFEWIGLAKFWLQVTSSFHYLYTKIVLPIYNWVYWLFFHLFWKHFRGGWNKYTYKNGSFSKVRGAAYISTTAALLFVLYHFVFILADAGLYIVTGNVNEIVYLANAQEISPEDNSFSVQGCTAPADGEVFSCSTNDSLYFRIEPSAFNHIWSVVNTGNIFFPDYVAAPIAPGWQECEVTSYGIRIKLLMRNWDIYPELLSAKCSAIKG